MKQTLVSIANRLLSIADDASWMQCVKVSNALLDGDIELALSLCDGVLLCWLRNQLR